MWTAPFPSAILDYLFFFSPAASLGAEQHPAFVTFIKTSEAQQPCFEHFVQKGIKFCRKKKNRYERVISPPLIYCWLAEPCSVRRVHLQEHSHADLVSLQDLLTRLPHMLLPLDVTFSAALLQRHTRQTADQNQWGLGDSEKASLCNIYSSCIIKIQDMISHTTSIHHSPLSHAPICAE